jgi:hypothetical protein
MERLGDMRMNLVDNQQAMAFLVSQTTYIEAEVYRTQYPDIIYPQLVPIDTSAMEWAKSVTYFSVDKVGKADWLSSASTELPLADINRNKFEQTIEMAAIGYRYNLEEVGQAMMIPGLNLTSERAEAAVRAYEEFMDKLARFGSTAKNFTGLFNNTNIPQSNAIADGTGSSSLWSTKTADQMIRDVQASVTNVYQSSLTVEMADTVLLPITQYQLLADTRIPNTAISALDYLKKYNVYTSTTGQELMIRGVLNLDTAGVGGTARMMTYRRDPRVLKLHVPMIHKFLPVWQTGPITFDIPGIFRVGGVEVRRPGACRYTDSI